MRRSLLFLLFLPLLLPATAAAQRRPYVDPVLRGIMRPGGREAVAQTLAAARGREAGPAIPRRAPTRGRLPEFPAGERHASPYAGLALTRDGAGSGVSVGVLVRLREPIPASLAALRRAGARVGSVVGTIATARVPLDALDRLAGAVEVERVEAARRLSLPNDSSMKAVRATEVRRRDGDLWYGSAGHGVIFGMYDTGIDYRHEDFRDAEGRSRVIGLWDQSRTGSAPPGFGYGSYCDGASLTNGSCGERDYVGHGTHVAGTAAGDGSAAGTGTAYTYTGVAPAAGLLVVKGSGFTEDEIVDGVNWIFQTAAALGRPAVVNLSLGLQWGARDGTSLFEQALDDLSGPGRIVVVAAGNDASNGNTSPVLTHQRFHAMDTPVLGSSFSFGIQVPSITPQGGSCNDFGLIELWYDGADRIDIDVVRPGGTTVTAAYGDVTTQNSTDGFVGIDNASDGPDPDNGDHQAVIEISDCGSSGAPRSGTWTVRGTPTVAPSGEPVHLWISYTQFGADGVLRGTSANFDNGYIVTSPGTAREVVTVGAYVTRTSWTSLAGGRRWVNEEQTGDIAYFSGGGPTRDGRMKPDIAAPGRTIFSSLSADAHFINDFIATDGVHVALQGTSMATPHVAGAIAALLQHDPTLTPSDVKSVFQRTAIQDEFTVRTYTGEPTGVSPNDQWGWGKLDVRAAVEDLVDPSLVAGVLVVPDADSVAPGFSVQLWAQPYNAVGDTVGTAVAWSSSDPSVAVVDAGGLVTGVSLGTATIQATADGKVGTAEISVIPPVASVAIEPATATLIAGEAAVLTATPLSDTGQPLPGRIVTWSSTDTLVARVDTAGKVTSIEVGTAGIIAESEGQRDTASIDVLTPSTLVVEANAIPASSVASTEQGTRIVLLQLRMHVDGPESVRVSRIGFTLTGDDPLATAQLYDDADADSAVDAGAVLLAGRPVALIGGGETVVDLTPSALVVPAGDTAVSLLALELSGSVPNGTSFQARYEPDRLRTVGTRSGASDRLDQPATPVAGASVPTTVLRPGEVFALSENPVMSDRVIFNFSERPRVAAVYMLNGTRVVDLLARMESDGRVEWDLTNEKGTVVAPGIYLVAFEVAGQLITRKLIIVRRSDREE